MFVEKVGRSDGRIGAGIDDIVGDIIVLGDAARSGRLAIDPDRASDALKELATVKRELSTLVNEHANLRPELKLGANPVGEAIAGKLAERHSGADGSLATFYGTLLEQTEHAEQALRQCIRNYEGTDSDGAARLSGAGEGAPR